MLVLKDTAHCVFVTRNVVGTLAKVSSFSLIGSYLKIDNRCRESNKSIQNNGPEQTRKIISTLPRANTTIHGIGKEHC